MSLSQCFLTHNTKKKDCKRKRKRIPLLRFVRNVMLKRLFTAPRTSGIIHDSSKQPYWNVWQKEAIGGGFGDGDMPDRSCSYLSRCLLHLTVLTTQANRLTVVNGQRKRDGGVRGRGRETGQERKRSGTRHSQTANHNMTQPGGSNPDSPPASHCALSQHSTTFLRMPALKGVSGCVAAVRGDTGSRGPWRPGRGPCEAHVDQAARPEAT